MFKIPPDYHLKKMAKSETPKEWYSHYTAFFQQMYRQSTHNAKKVGAFMLDSMNQLFKK